MSSQFLVSLLYLHKADELNCLPEYGIGSPVLLEDRITILIDGERGDTLHCGQTIELVHAVQVGLGELVVLDVGEGVSEPGEEGDQLIVAEEVELNRGGLQSTVFVPGSFQIFYCG